MTVIFNKIKAIQNREKIHEQVKKENRRRTMKKIILTVLYSCFLAGTVIAIFFTKYNINLKGIIFATAILMGFLVPSLLKILKENSANTIFPNTKYSPDVQYLVLTKGKKASDYNLIEHDKYADISFITENKDGKIERNYIRGFKKKSSKEVKDVTVNLETATVYIPSSL